MNKKEGNVKASVELRVYIAVISIKKLSVKELASLFDRDIFKLHLNA